MVDLGVLFFEVLVKFIIIVREVLLLFRWRRVVVLFLFIGSC